MVVNERWNGRLWKHVNQGPFREGRERVWIEMRRVKYKKKVEKCKHGVGG